MLLEQNSDKMEKHLSPFDEKPPWQQNLDEPNSLPNKAGATEEQYYWKIESLQSLSVTQGDAGISILAEMQEDKQTNTNFI